MVAVAPKTKQLGWREIVSILLDNELIHINLNDI